MTNEQRMKNLCVPCGKVDVVLDTDAYNEVDDQFAISYLLRSKEKLNTKAIYAAPFHNTRSVGPKDGMEKSYDEIFRLLDVLDEKVDVFRGSESFLSDENTPVISDAARDLAQRAENYSPENPLYVIAIAAITNVASAILLNPKVAENTVVVWLGGHSCDMHNTMEFNMMQDVAAARVVMGSGVPLVQLPCFGVVSALTISGPELEYWLNGKTAIGTYLTKTVIDEANTYAEGLVWTRCIWDISAVAWMLNDGDRFMWSRIIPTHMPTYEHQYCTLEDAHPMRYIYYIHRDEVFRDLINKLNSGK